MNYINEFEAHLCLKCQVYTAYSKDPEWGYGSTEETRKEKHKLSHSDSKETTPHF